MPGSSAINIAISSKHRIGSINVEIFSSWYSVFPFNARSNPSVIVFPVIVRLFHHIGSDDLSLPIQATPHLEHTGATTEPHREDKKLFMTYLLSSLLTLFLVILNP